MPEIYRARVNASIVFQGRRRRLVRGVTTAHAGHPILDEAASMFEPLRVDFAVEAPVEQATARPGEKRAVRTKAADKV